MEKAAFNNAYVGYQELRLRGWNDRDVYLFLGTADKEIQRNGNKASLKFWSRKRILDIENSVAFRLLRKDDKLQVKGNHRAGARHFQQQVTGVMEFDVLLPTASFSETRSRALEDYRQHWEARGRTVVFRQLEESKVEQAMVHYLRRMAIVDPGVRKGLKDQLGSREAEQWVYIRTGQAIAERYPQLKNLCEQQARAVLGGILEADGSRKVKNEASLQASPEQSGDSAVGQQGD